MKKMIHWGKSVAFLTLMLSAMGGMNATATVFTSSPTSKMIFASELTPLQNRGNVQLAQRRVGECRAAARSTFIYQERSTANRIRALQPNEQVTLVEERSREGWVAISSPISGFVETKDLKLCSGGAGVSTRPSSSNLCRQVTYQGTEGVAIRERPDINSRQVSAVFLGERVTLSKPPEFITDDTGREWARLAAPSVGWMSNGIPARGDINLVACSQ
jgi:hypothetical protein